MNRDVLAQLDGVDAEQFVKPVKNGPLGAVETAPGGLHRVFGVRFGIHGGDLT